VGMKLLLGAKVWIGYDKPKWLQHIFFKATCCVLIKLSFQKNSTKTLDTTCKMESKGFAKSKIRPWIRVIR
jgi:hypothetical protein